MIYDILVYLIQCYRERRWGIMDLKCTWWHIIMSGIIKLFSLHLVNNFLFIKNSVEENYYGNVLEKTSSDNCKITWNNNLNWHDNFDILLLLRVQTLNIMNRKVHGVIYREGSDLWKWNIERLNIKL